MQKYKSNITTTSGAAVRGVPVLVIDEDGNNAALFLDRAGTVTAPNPLTTGADGTFYFYAINGRYSLRTTVDGVTITDDDVVLMMDPEEITVAGPIAEAVAAAQAAATAAEFAVEDSGIPELVSAAQNAVVDANAALAQAIASSNSAALSKTDADAARDAAVTAKMAAEAALDSFDDRYLGAKAVAPTVDNDGAALLIGALYWDTALPGMRSWNGSAWVTLQAATAAAISNTPAGSIAATTVQSAIDELDAEKAPLSSPALTGTPTAPTAAPGTNTTQLATTEYARAAAIAFGGIKAYATHAEASIAAALLPDGADAEVSQDETRAGARTRYKVQAGALVFVVNLDQLRVDLDGADATKGSSLVKHLQQDVGSVAMPMRAFVSSFQGGLGDYSVDGHLLLFCGDSTTEQEGAVGYGFDQMTRLRAPGEKLEKILGTINFGGSGHQISSWVNGPLGPLPAYSASNLGAGNNDYYGHKPTGATTLATQLAWRAGKAKRVTWSICYGINDCILNASVGNLSQSAISDFIESYLHAAITRIKAAYPQDRIVLQTPNPMTARPYNSGAGFPSAVAYPSFGADATDDQMLVEKWNQGIYGAYIAAKNKHPGTLLFDTWAAVFGKSDTALLAASQIPFLGDLVHPSQAGYVARARARVALLCGDFIASPQRRAEADARAKALGVNPWDVYPGYFRGNPRYKLLAEGTFTGASSNFVDLGIPFTQWRQQVAGPCYIVVGDRVAQYFATYNPTASGNYTRLLSVAPSAALQAAISGQTLHVYGDSIVKWVADDPYVDGLAVASKEYIDLGKIVSAGVGFIDFTIPKIPGRISSKFLTGISNATLVVGGTVNATLSLAMADITRSGTTSQRSVRILVEGSYASYAGQPAALTFADDKPSPKAFEYLPKVVAYVPHAVGNKGFVFCPMRLVDGATLGVSMITPLASTVEVEVYELKYPNRTLLGTIAVAANASGANLPSGNPTSVGAGVGYEFVITSTTTTTAPILCTVTPN